MRADVSTSGPQRLWNVIRSANMVVMDSVWDLDIGGLDESRFVIALTIVAAGAAVLPARSWGCTRPHVSSAVVHFQPACRKGYFSLVLDPAFAAKYPGVSKIGKNIQNIKDSRWKFSTSSSAGATDTKISTLDDLRRFLQRERRIHRPVQGLSGAYFPSRVAP